MLIEMLDMLNIMLDMIYSAYCVFGQNEVECSVLPWEALTVEVQGWACACHTRTASPTIPRSSCILYLTAAPLVRRAC